MKQDFVKEVIKKIKSQPKLMRKVKIFAAIGAVSFLIMGALIVWAGISAVKFVVSQTSELTQSHIAEEQIENLNLEIEGVLRLRPLNCWGKAQSLMAAQPWIERPAIENLKNLKLACLEHAPPKCQGADCALMKEIINTAEGRTI